jgi:Acyl-CoA dehydrogenase, C-terminal domain
MDYGVSASEKVLLDGISSLVEGRGGAERLLAAATRGSFDPELDAALAAAAGTRAPLHLRLLVVEEAARLGLPAWPGARLLAGCDLFGELPSQPVAVVDRRRPGPARIPASGGLLLSIAGDDAWFAEVPAAAVSSVPSSFGYSFGTVAPEQTTALPPGSAALIRARWHLALAGEIASTAQGALHQLTSHLRQREQFGTRLSSFQALRHRVAELAVSANAAVWLARQAAWHGDGYRAGLAAVYARELAARSVPELVQLGGARSFSLDFPLNLFAMRLQGLRLMLGSADRLAGETTDARERETVA